MKGVNIQTSVHDSFAHVVVFKGEKQIISVWLGFDKGDIEVEQGELTKK